MNTFWFGWNENSGLKTAFNRFFASPDEKCLPPSNYSSKKSLELSAQLSVEIWRICKNFEPTKSEKDIVVGVLRIHRFHLNCNRKFQIWKCKANDSKRPMRFFFNTRNFISSLFFSIASYLNWKCVKMKISYFFVAIILRILQIFQFASIKSYWNAIAKSIQPLFLLRWTSKNSRQHQTPLLFPFLNDPNNRRVHLEIVRYESYRWMPA